MHSINHPLKLPFCALQWKTHTCRIQMSSYIGLHNEIHCKYKHYYIQLFQRRYKFDTRTLKCRRFILPSHWLQAEKASNLYEKQAVRLLSFKNALFSEGNMNAGTHCI